jgi:hypothetical protein
VTQADGLRQAKCAGSVCERRDDNLCFSDDKSNTAPTHRNGVKPASGVDLSRIVGPSFKRVSGG